MLYDLEDSLNGDRKGFDKLLVSLRLLTYWISVRKYIFHASRVGVCWIRLKCSMTRLTNEMLDF